MEQQTQDSDSERKTWHGFSCDGVKRRLLQVISGLRLAGCRPLEQLELMLKRLSHKK